MTTGQRKHDKTLTSVHAVLNYPETKSLIDEVIEKYEEIGLSENQFCKLMGIQRGSWRRFVAGEQQSVDIALFIKLAHFLERTESEVIELYRKSVRNNERQELDDVKRYSFIANRFDLKRLRKIKFFDGKLTDFASFERRIKQFFLFDNIYEYREIEVKPWYSKTKAKSSDRMLQFWNTMVRRELQSIDNPNAFDRPRFKKIIAQFRAATLDVDLGLAKVVRALYECGVTVIVQSYVAKTSIRGATFAIKGKPYIVLTNLKKKYATLWQTLAHECYHVLTRFDEIARQGYRINTDERELFDNEMEEEAAHEFARHLFFDEKNWSQLEKYIGFEAIVEQLAANWNVHPSLLYNVYLERNPKQYGRFAQYLTKSHSTVQNLEVKEPWQEATIEIPVSELRKKFEPEPVLR